MSFLDKQDADIYLKLVVKAQMRTATRFKDETEVANGSKMFQLELPGPAYMEEVTGHTTSTSYQCQTFALRLPTALPHLDLVLKGRIWKADREKRFESEKGVLELNQFRMSSTFNLM